MNEHGGMHSQYGEDKAIAEACTAANGRFLDIGAWNAITFSNTRLLYERGWSGVLIEPSPGPYLGLVEAYGKDPKIKLIQACVGFERHPVKLFITDDCTSTTDAETHEKWRALVNYTGEILAQQMTIEDVYQDGPFDFVSIDSEGTSVDLFHRIMDLGHRPTCLCIEHDGRVGELAQRATEAGYKLTYANGTNVVVVR